MEQQTCHVTGSPDTPIQTTEVERPTVLFVIFRMTFSQQFEVIVRRPIPIERYAEQYRYERKDRYYGRVVCSFHMVRLYTGRYLLRLLSDGYILPNFRQVWFSPSL